VEIARRERRSSNLPEVVLWRVLRTRPGELRFRKQHPLGHYSLDFACLAARLAIEVDGEIHSRGDHPARDARRDAIVADHGFATLRISAKDVLNDLDAVITAIVSACRDRLPLHHRASPGGPPPRSGEVF
jgi:very-short-patch-repair endonuclease